MNANEIKLIANAVEIAGFEIDETKPLYQIYEDAFNAMTFYAKENPDEFEVVVGEFSNGWSHLYAQSKDDTEFECDGEIIDGSTEDGQIIENFVDKDGNMVLVIFRDGKTRYMHVETGSVDTEENWICDVTDEELEERFVEGTTKQEAFDEYCRDGKFVEVQKDVHGNWVEV